jgi:hypothetical protein
MTRARLTLKPSRNGCRPIRPAAGAGPGGGAASGALRRRIILACLAGVALPARAHGYRAGDLHIRHPYATPTPPGAKVGAAYLATLENRGTRADRLLGAASPIAERIELHASDIDAAGVMRMRRLEAIDLAPGAAVRLRPGRGAHLMLLGLKQPLKVGDSFPLTLQFEHAGSVEVRVDVQKPGRRAAETAHH